jgi:hypothetical protein
MILPTPPPKGAVHTFPLLALQFAVRMGETLIYQPFFML